MISPDSISFFEDFKANLSADFHNYVPKELLIVLFLLPSVCSSFAWQTEDLKIDKNEKVEFLNDF